MTTKKKTLKLVKTESAQSQSTPKQPIQNQPAQNQPMPNQSGKNQSTAPVKKSNAIYWVCGCFTCCGIILLLIILWWILSWYGIRSPGLLPAIMGK